VVWRRAFALCVEVYRLTEAFPNHERFGLSAELRKTARSVAYNIAEGHRRRSTVEYLRFLDIARGSAGELETQFLLAQALTYFDAKAAIDLLDNLAEIDRMLITLMRKLRDRVTQLAR
jgi:four helix bundle protein